MATLNGKTVDRPAVSFYEIGGLKMDPSDKDPFNIYNDPSWRPLLRLAEEHTDLIRMRSAVRAQSHEPRDTSGSQPKPIREEFFKTEQYCENGCRMTRTTLKVGGRTMASVARRKPEIDTLWTTEHLLKSTRDVRAYLELPDEVFAENIDVLRLEEEDRALGDRGIVMVDTEDPLCAVAMLFSMADFTVFAMTENKLCRRLLEKCARHIHSRTEEVARRFPGHLWRIYGPEFAAEPYLPPNLFDEYVVGYTQPMVEMIKKHGGFSRVHIHGRIRNVLDSIVGMGADAIDPVEPPPQGDVELEYVRRRYGKDLVIFGNLEVADIENMAPEAFAAVVQKSLFDGTKGQGRGFVLMPSASPCGRTLSPRAMRNYETIIRIVETC